MSDIYERAVESVKKTIREDPWTVPWMRAVAAEVERLTADKCGKEWQNSKWFKEVEVTIRQDERRKVLDELDALRRRNHPFPPLQVSGEVDEIIKPTAFDALKAVMKLAMQTGNPVLSSGCNDLLNGHRDTAEAKAIVGGEK
jgi:hypothetical protein